MVVEQTVIIAAECRVSGVKSPSLDLDLRRFPLFAGLGDEDLHRIAAKLHPREMRRGTTLILETDFPQKVCLVSSGRFRLVIAAPPNANVVFRSLGPGATFGGIPAVLGRGFGQRMRLVCDETGVVFEMDGADFHAFRRELPPLNEAFMLMLATIASDQGSRIFELSVLVARERLQAELLRLARDGEWSGGRCVIKPAPTQQTLSEQIGTSREVITRTLKEMCREGLVRTEAGAIEILDANKLLDLDEAATGRRMFDPPPSKTAAQ